MSNSGLATVKIPSPNYSTRTMKIVGVAIHCMAGNLTVEACGNLFASSDRAASSNYGIGTDGRIALYVDEGLRSWCTSSNDVDQRAVTIEVANNAYGDPWPISDSAYMSLINLLVDICVRNDIPALRWEANQSYGVNFNVDKQNMWAHRWFANKSCPGDYMYSRFGNMASEVNNRLKSMSASDKQKIITAAQTGVAYTPTSMNASSAYTALVDPQSVLNPQIVNTYIATVDRSTTVKDFTKFSDNNITGVVIEAGYLFTSNHSKVSMFKNPKLDDQVHLASQAMLPYGFYFVARGRNTDEIREEIYQLSFILRKYPTQLGLWLVIDLTAIKTKNDELLDDYYKRLLDLGLYRQLGLYVTENQLRTINWSKHQDEWWLWINKHYQTDSEFNDVVTPYIFDVEVT